MKTILVEAKNVEKAIQEGLKQLNVAQEDVDIKIISEGGFFKKAKVEITVDDGVVVEETEAPVVEEPEDDADVVSVDIEAVIAAQEEEAE